MLTRLPSGRRASTSGLDSSMRRPTRVTILVQMFIRCCVVAERDVGQFELAAAFDVDLLRAVDHDVGDGLVGEQRLERAEPEHVGDQRFDELALLGEVQLDLGLGEQFLDPAGQLRLEGGARHLGRGGNVHVFEDQRLDLRLGRLDRRPVRGSSRFSRRRRRGSRSLCMMSVTRSRRASGPASIACRTK